MTEKPVKYVAKTTPATCWHARFGAPDACLAHLRRAGLDHPSLTKRGRTLTTAHERHVARTFALSHERLDPQDPTDTLAQALLASSACFAPGEPTDLGDRVTTAVREIARENPDLKDVIDISDYNATTAEQCILPDGQLAELSEILSRYRLGLHAPEPDL
jgi:hypothetical protein